jgi:hypothetical protein
MGDTDASTGKWQVTNRALARDALVRYIMEKQQRAQNSEGLVSLIKPAEGVTAATVLKKSNVSPLRKDKDYGWIFPVIYSGTRYFVSVYDGKVLGQETMEPKVRRRK